MARSKKTPQQISLLDEMRSIAEAAGFRFSKERLEKLERWARIVGVDLTSRVKRGALQPVDIVFSQEYLDARQRCDLYLSKEQLTELEVFEAPDLSPPMEDPPHS